MDDMFNRLTREFFGLEGWERPKEGEALWEPAIECHLENSNLVVKVDLPGIEAKDVNISVLGSELTIEGERKRDRQEAVGGSFHDELPYGKFSRKMKLPEEVEADKIKTAYKNGVLELTMPAPKQLVSKKIPIEIEK